MNLIDCSNGCPTAPFDNNKGTGLDLVLDSVDVSVLVGSMISVLDSVGDWALHGIDSAWEFSVR